MFFFIFNKVFISYLGLFKIVVYIYVCFNEYYFDNLIFLLSIKYINLRKILIKIYSELIVKWI